QALRTILHPNTCLRCSAGCLSVYTPPQRYGRQLSVCGFLFAEVRVEEPDDVIMTGRFGPCDQGSIARDLVVLDGLSRADNSGIQNFLVGDLGRHFVGLSDETVNRGAFHGLRPFAELLEDLVEANDLLPGFFEMALQPYRQIAV